jgi:hypothetical protein
MSKNVLLQPKWSKTVEKYIKHFHMRKKIFYHMKQDITYSKCDFTIDLRFNWFTLALLHTAIMNLNIVLYFLPSLGHESMHAKNIYA